jgi:hypothetical protein
MCHGRASKWALVRPFGTSRVDGGGDPRPGPDAPVWAQTQSLPQIPLAVFTIILRQISWVKQSATWYTRLHFHEDLIHKVIESTIDLIDVQHVDPKPTRSNGLKHLSTRGVADDTLPPQLALSLCADVHERVLVGRVLFDEIRQGRSAEQRRVRPAVIKTRRLAAPQVRVLGSRSVKAVSIEAMSRAPLLVSLTVQITNLPLFPTRTSSNMSASPVEILPAFRPPRRLEWAVTTTHCWAGRPCPPCNVSSFG